MTVFFWVSFAVLWLVVVIQGLAFLEVLRQVSQLRRQVAPQKGALVMQGAVQAGAPLPTLTGYSAKNQQPGRWSDYLKKPFGLVVLLSTHCITCRAIAADLTGFATDLPDDATVVAIVEGKAEEAELFISKAQMDRRMVIIDEEGATAQAFGVSWNPAVITVHKGKLGEAAIVNDIHQLSSLVPVKEEEDAFVG